MYDKLKLYLLPLMLSLLTVLSVFFSEKIIPFVVAVIILLFFLEKNKKENFLIAFKYIKPFLYYVLLHVLYTAFANDISPALKLLERQLVILVIPVIVLSSNLSKNRSSFFVKSYLLIMLIVSVISVLKLMVFLNTYDEWITFMNNEKGNFTYVQFKYPHLMRVHPTYWSYLLVISNLLLLNNKNLSFFKNRKLVITLLVIFNINLFYLSARTPITINLIIHLITLFYYFNENKIKRITVVFYAVMFLMIFSILFLQPLMYLKMTNIINDDRFYLWPKAFEIIKSNFFILGEGLGAGNNILKMHLFETFDERNNYYGIDLHNNYLKVYVDMGVLGFLSLVYIIINPFLVSIKNNKLVLLNLGYSFLFLISIMTESTLYVVKGIVVFSVFSSFLIKQELNLE